MRPDDPSLLRDTEARVLAWCEQAGLFAHGQRVAAAVSGGADSMALLRILLALAGLACLGCALGWLWLPVPGPGPDGLLEPEKTKALLPDEWRGELCSSIVSNQS